MGWWRLRCKQLRLFWCNSVRKRRKSHIKVHIFWEGHKFLQNLHRRFVLCSNSQTYGEDFGNFCGLLRILIYINFSPLRANWGQGYWGGHELTLSFWRISKPNSNRRSVLTHHITNAPPDFSTFRRLCNAMSKWTLAFSIMAKKHT